MYNNGEYRIKERKTYYKVTQTFNDEFEVYVEKSTIEKLQINEDHKELAIFIAVIEFIRNQNSTFNKTKDFKIVESQEFIEHLRVDLQFVSLESLTFEISKMKYYEIKEFFM